MDGGDDHVFGCDGGGTKTEYMLFDLSDIYMASVRHRETNAIFINPDAAADACVRRHLRLSATGRYPGYGSE